MTLLFTVLTFLSKRQDWEGLQEFVSLSLYRYFSHVDVYFLTSSMFSITGDVEQLILRLNTFKEPTF